MKKQETIKIKQSAFYQQVLDFLLTPLMQAVAGFNGESPQESHKWHMQKIDNHLIPDKDCLKIMGDDPSKFDNRTFLIHVPILGGWKNYVILQASTSQKYWHLGWKIKYLNNRQDITEVQKLKIYDPQIKILKGKNDSQKLLFALSEKGQLIPLKKSWGRPLRRWQIQKCKTFLNSFARRFLYYRKCPFNIFCL